MEHSLTAADYLERADMHECLAGATADQEARKMHRAMAEEYRRRARAVREGASAPSPPTRKLLELATPQQAMT